MDHEEDNVMNTENNEENIPETPAENDPENETVEPEETASPEGQAAGTPDARTPDARTPGTQTPGTQTPGSQTPQYGGAPSYGYDPQTGYYAYRPAKQPRPTYSQQTYGTPRNSETEKYKKSNRKLKIALIIVAAVLALVIMAGTVFTACGALLLTYKNRSNSGLTLPEAGDQYEEKDPKDGNGKVPDKKDNKQDETPAPSSYDINDWIKDTDKDESNPIVAAAAVCSPSVVAVTVGTARGSSAGSGVIWSSNGYIVTNNHVVENAYTVEVMLANNKSYPATVIAVDEENDLALIRINVTGLLPATLGSSEDLQVGETVIAIGNALGTLANTVTSGILSAQARDITVDGQPMNLMQISAAINPGNSGGGCFDVNGRLIGIVNAKSSAVGIEGLGFAIPIDTVKSVISKMVENDSSTLRKSFGITSCYEVNESNYADYSRRSSLMQKLEELNGAPMYGIYIASDGLVDYVDDTNTFENGDVILTVNGKEVTCIADNDAILEELNNGDILTVVVARLTAVTSGRRVSYSIEEVTVQIRVIEMYR